MVDNAGAVSEQEDVLHKGVIVFGSLLLLLATAWNPVSAQSGKTIFGDNKRSTFKAMKAISKALGVKCLFCHVKEGGKPQYEIDTPYKELTRKMKTAFVDSLLIKGQVELLIDAEGHKTTIKAVHTTTGDTTGIHLTATTADGKAHAVVLPLPPKGGTNAINCMTCHNGKTHIFTPAEDKG